MNAAIGGIEMAGESLKRIDRLRVVLLIEAVQGAEDAKRRRHGKAERFELNRDLGGQDSSCRCSVENDVAGLVGLEHFPVDGDGVIDSGGKWMLRREAVEHRDDFDPGVAGDRNRFGIRAGVGVKSTAVQVDENLVVISGGQVGWSYDAHRNTGES